MLLVLEMLNGFSSDFIGHSGGGETLIFLLNCQWSLRSHDHRLQWDFLSDFWLFERAGYIHIGGFECTFHRTGRFLEATNLTVTSMVSERLCDFFVASPFSFTLHHIHTDELKHFFLHGEFCTTLFYILCLCAISHGLTMLDLYYVQCKFDAGAGRRNSRLDSCKIYKVLKVS